MAGTIREKIRDELCYMGFGRDNLSQVRHLVDDSNRRALTAWSVFISAYMVISLLLSLCLSSFESCRPIYIVSLAVCLFTWAYSTVLWRRLPQYLSRILGLFYVAVLGLGLGIAFYQPDVRSVTMIAIAIIIPTCFIAPTMSVIVFQTLAFAVFATFGHLILAPDVYLFGVLTLFLFSIMGTMVGHLINKARFERFVYADSVERLAELQTRYAYYDAMTGLKNRRAYMERIEGVAKGMPDDFHIIMVDLNGLKETNDTYGHKAGDEMLMGVARCLSEAFGDCVYRLGGDEFGIVISESDADIERRMGDLTRLTSEWVGTRPGGISFSYGIGSSHGPESTTDSVAKEADRQMYEHKRHYYAKSGTDRRRRHDDRPGDGTTASDGDTRDGV